MCRLDGDEGYILYRQKRAFALKATSTNSSFFLYTHSDAVLWSMMMLQQLGKKEEIENYDRENNLLQWIKKSSFNLFPASSFSFCAAVVMSSLTGWFYDFFNRVRTDGEFQLHIVFFSLFPLKNSAHKQQPCKVYDFTWRSFHSYSYFLVRLPGCCCCRVHQK